MHSSVPDGRPGWRLHAGAGQDRRAVLAALSGLSLGAEQPSQAVRGYPRYRSMMAVTASGVRGFEI